MKKALFFLFLSIAFSSAVAQKNLLYKLKTHSVGGLSYSNDQTFLALADGKDILLYAAATHTLASTLEGHSGPIHSISFSPDGSQLASAGSDKMLIIWDYLKKTIVSKIKNEEEILDAQYIDVGHIAAITPKKLLVYDLSGNKLVYSKNNFAKPLRSLAVSKDSKWLAVGGGDGNIIVYEPLSGNLIRGKKVHNGWVKTLAASPDGTYLISGDDKGNTVLQNISTEEQHPFTEADGWVISSTFSDDSKYCAIGDDKGNTFIYEMEKKFLTQKLSPTNQPIVSLDFSPDGNELAMIEQFSSIEVWNVKDLRISSVFKIKDDKDNSPPQILISNPPNIQNDRYRYSKDFIEIRGIVIDDAGVRSLTVNGITTPLKENGNFVIHLPLAMGDNFISIEAKDINENLGGKKFIISRKDLLGEEYSASKAKNYLFIVGINDYEHWPRLFNAVKDANDVGSTLMGMYNFEFDHVTFLKNEQATRSNIYKSLRALVEKVTPQDNLLIYYSGHGVFDELLKEGYWIPVDAELNSSGDYLSNSDLLKIVGNIDSQHTFIVADACFSGSLFSESKRGYSENVERYKSRWGLVSGRLESVSDGSQGTNSPFATAFLQFLKDNPKAKFSASELVQFVKIKVAETSDQTPLGNPLKGAGDEGGEFIFYKKN